MYRLYSFCRLDARVLSLFSSLNGTENSGGSDYRAGASSCSVSETVGLLNWLISCRVYCRVTISFSSFFQQETWYRIFCSPVSSETRNSSHINRLCENSWSVLSISLKSSHFEANATRSRDTRSLVFSSCSIITVVVWPSITRYVPVVVGESLFRPSFSVFWSHRRKTWSPFEKVYFWRRRGASNIFYTTFERLVVFFQLVKGIALITTSSRP